MKCASVAIIGRPSSGKSTLLNTICESKVSITSPTGAAVQDIFNVTGRRFPIGDIVFCPVTVQGPTAPADMIDALQRLCDGHPYTVEEIFRDHPL